MSFVQQIKYDSARSANSRPLNGPMRVNGPMRYEVHPEDNAALIELYPESRTWVYENYTLTDRAEKLAGSDAIFPPHKYVMSCVYTISFLIYTFVTYKNRMNM